MNAKRFWTEIVLISLAGLYLVSPPLFPQQSTVTLEDDLVAETVPGSELNEGNNLHGTVGGQYIGHNSLQDTSKDAPATVKVVADQPRLMFIASCSHELTHYELEQSGVDLIDHHAAMDATRYNAYNPVNWDRRCLKLWSSLIL